MSPELEIRRMVEDDLPFVKATWLNNYKNNSYFAKRIKNSVYFRAHRLIADGILSRPGTEVLVCYPAVEPDIIFGFLVWERMGTESIVHFCFVKEELRRKGIGRGLIEHSGIDLPRSLFTHWTMDMNDLIKRFPEMTYDPYRI